MPERHNVRMRPSCLRLIPHTLAALLVALLSPITASAVVETDYSQSPFDAAGIVRIVVALIGGLIAILGFIVVLRGIQGKADIRVAVGKGRGISFKQVNQGVVIIITGVILLVGSIYLLPAKTREVTRTEDVTITPEGTTVHHLKR